MFRAHPASYPTGGLQSFRFTIPYATAYCPPMTDMLFLDAKINDPAYMNGVCVTQIGEMAFAEYEVPSITSVTLPDTVRVIGDKAFSGCTRLSKINISAGLIPSIHAWLRKIGRIIF